MGLTMIKKISDKIFPAKKGKKYLNSLLDYIPNISKNDIIIDFGANVGNVIKPISNIGCQIIAFEPNPYAFKILKQNYEYNKNVNCIRKAVSTKNGMSKLFLHENSEQDNLLWSTGSSLVKTKNNVDSSNYVIVETINFSEYLLSLEGQIKLVKIDIEGEELNVINQILDNDLNDKIDHILVETHQKKIPSHRTKLDNLKKRIREMNISNISLDWH